ncbi:MAG: glycine cleavage system transcriptional repressor [Endomicrobiales bacterium]
MKKHVAISVLGKDRPGIVAAVSKVLFETGCNIEDSSMTILRSEFAMILVVALGGKLTVEDLKMKLSAAGKEQGLSIYVRALSPEEEEKESAGGSRYVVSVYGADKPGIVYRISRLLSENAVNITDVQTTIRPGKEGMVYIMFLEVTLPKSLKAKAMKEKLAKTARALKVTVGVNPVESPQM